MLSTFSPFRTHHFIFFFIFIICSVTFAQWYEYPTYGAYVGYMEKWQKDYPQLAKLYDLGPSDSGTHRIYALRISDNVEQNEAEPRYLQTAALNRNEALAYMLSLHLIDTLLSSYGSDNRITELVNYAELWFFPLCNPDATYPGGNNSITQAKISADDINLNSNWPCPCMQGNHEFFGIYDSLAPEVTAIMNVHTMYRFNLHTDMHDGGESVLWPYGAISNKVCDEDWFIWAAGRYADQIHADCGNNGYMTSCGDDGIGHYWSDYFEHHGTRMDFCTHFGKTKGFQIETCAQKLPDESQLKEYWIWNKEALFQYLELLYSGVQGVVTNAINKEPVNHVNITAVNHDFDNAAVFTDSAGYYLRFIEKGTYSFTFSHPDYHSKTVDSITIDDYSKKYELDVELEISTGIENTISLSNLLISIIPVSSGVKIMFNRKLDDIVNVSIYDLGGKKIGSIPAVKKSVVWDGRDDNNNIVSNGCYLLQLQAGGKKYCRSFMFLR